VVCTEWNLALTGLQSQVRVYLSTEGWCVWAGVQGVQVSVYACTNLLRHIEGRCTACLLTLECVCRFVG
jgi:hypothetical protein